DGEFIRFDSVRVNPKPVADRAIPIVLGGNSDAALRRVVRWGDGWYGFNLDGVPAVADRGELLGQLCRDAGRARAEFRLAVALTQPRAEDVSALAELGIDELVIVAAPPHDVGEV